MKTSTIIALVGLALSASACGQTAQTVTLQSLESSGRTSFLCLSSETFDARSIDDCPDFVPDTLDGEDRHLYSMVTQKTRGEVAVLDLSLGTVLDEDVSVPGFTFLPVGASPTSIVSTPGSSATFVGVGEVGKTGIYAIPSSCVKPREAGEPIRDITTWPACQLPEAPGDMAILIDPPPNVLKPGELRTSCSSEPDPNEGRAAKDPTCPADLSLETRKPGRRKLAVSLPGRGQIAIIDAQRLLNLQPGSFEACPIEVYLSLAVDLPATPIAQKLPPDLQGQPLPTGLFQPPPNPSNDPHSHPGGFAQVDDPITLEHRLFVADTAEPVVHSIETSDPCNPVEGAPLLPMSFNDPTRIVTTTRLAASQLTNDQKRYLYAIDGTDALGGGSVMIFDVSQNSSNRTPLLRPNSPLLPFEPPDRIAFDAPARDVAFGIRDDVSVNPAPALPPQKIGVECDPLPSATGPGVRYRPTADLAVGARPAELRGVFGFILLESGQVAVIDVDDFDAACRRPAAINESSTPNFMGCSHDPPVTNPDTGAPGFTLGKGTTPTPTVTDEVSCHMVETHRSRSQRVMRNDAGVGLDAPSLRTLPKLVDDSGRTLVTDLTVEGREHPHMLGVNFSTTNPAQVYVGTELRQVLAQPPATPLVIDPAVATQSSVVLSFAEPRSYVPDEGFNARYEGPIVAGRPAGQLSDQGNGTATLTDGGIVFCDRGVEDEDAACDRGRNLLGLASTVPSADCYQAAPAGARKDNLGRFASHHADYVQITSDLLDPTNDWWKQGGASCKNPDPNQPGTGYLRCSSDFGTSVTPSPPRDLHIITATRNVLTVRPRSGTTLEEIECCFPTTVAYKVRASDEWVVTGDLSGFRNNITTNTDGQCVVDDNPLRAHLQGRVIETSCAGNGCSATDSFAGAPHTGVNQDNQTEVACVFDRKHPPSLTIGTPNSQCMFQGLNTSFTIYAGQPSSSDTPASLRDMEFDWEVLGGFSPLLVNVAPDGSIFTSPNSIQFLPQLQSVVVADGSSRGVEVLDLSSLALTTYL